MKTWKKFGLVTAALVVCLAAVLGAYALATHEMFSQAKAVLVCSPILRNSGAFTVTYADTAGFNRATFLFMYGASDITCDAQLQECDTSGGTYVNITGAAITQLSATDDGKMVAIEVNLAGRKRYLKPVTTAGAGTLGVNGCAVILLHQTDSAPTTATEAGLAEVKRV